LEQGLVVLRDMNSGSQKEVKIDEIEKLI